MDNPIGSQVMGLLGRRASRIGLAPLLVGALAAVLGGCAWLPKYAVEDRMPVPVREFSTAEYPEDPAGKSAHYGRYADRTLTLIKKDATHFDFIFEPTNAHTATVVFRDVDVSLFTPTLPDWTRGDADLERIALTDRQWNRQQVSFAPGTPMVEITGGNGFERTHLFSAELAKNCLNAGLWEVLLFTQEGGQKALYYQGWFTFPLGHYRQLFERANRQPYSASWRRLEHWVDPEGTPINLAKLRRVTGQRESRTMFLADEPIFAYGEQHRKLRTVNAKNLVTWKDFYDPTRSIEFASFVKPGRYNVGKPWPNQYARLSRFEGAALREIVSPASSRPLHEVELMFDRAEGGDPSRFIVSGFDLEALPRLAVADYSKGLYMPMGIGVPPFYQSYDALTANPPYRSPYFSVLLDAKDRWINHHEVAIDGVAMHRDAEKTHLVHLYLLSYERHSLIGHFVVDTQPAASGPSL